MFVSEFFLAYGLFAAKAVTLILVILLAVIALVLIITSRTRERERESIEIEKINDVFTSMKEALESELLTKDELKANAKAQKKREKEEDKARKKRLKEGVIEPLKSRLFVLRFVGDMEASEVDNLRQAITAILSVAQTSDEVLIILESAGGLVHNYGLAASQLNRIRERQIPLTASIDLVAASGGYLMACVANKIIAAPFAVVGSIGVLAQVPNFNRLLKKLDIDVEEHTAGEYKTTLTMFGENTDKDRDKFKQELDDTHQLFKQYVHDQRPGLNIDKLATGEHWYGTQAINLNLIDELITSDDYLLNRNESHDIYEVNYVITQSLSEKISSFLQKTTLRLANLVFNMPFFQSRL